MAKKGPRLRGGDYNGSDRNKHTRSPGYKPGDNWLVCDVCGCNVYSSAALERWDGAVVCKQDWEPRHEQDFVRARADKIKPDGLLRPEGEDDYTTIPGISGPDPIPPPSTEYFHDFSKDYMMPSVEYIRDFPDTTIDYTGNEVTVGNNIPTLAGYRWDEDAGRWYDEGVGYGLHLKSDGTTYWADTSDLAPVPAEGLSNNFCLQVTGQWLSTIRAEIGQTFNICVLYAYPNFPTILSLQTGKNTNTTPTTYISMNFFEEEVEKQDRSVQFPIELVEGQTFDLRVRKRSTEPEGIGSGVTGWLYVHDTNGTTVYGPLQGEDAGTPAVCSQDFSPPLNTLDWAIINNSETTIAERYIAQVRIYPGVLSDEEIESWPTWEAP